jgi:hypothetical protein
VLQPPDASSQDRRTYQHPAGIRLAFQELYDQPLTEVAAGFLKKWYFWATHSRLEPVIVMISR